MGWDDELEDLVSQVLDVYGHEHVTEALLRALRHVPRTPLSQDMLDLAPVNRRRTAVAGIVHRVRALHYWARGMTVEPTALCSFVVRGDRDSVLSE